MANFSSPSSSPPPPRSRRKLKNCARRCERFCCTIATYFPLAFVYSVTTWAVWVEGNIGLGNTGAKGITGSVKVSSLIGIILYFLLNASYSVAVFTDPGSPLRIADSKNNGKYSILPMNEPGHDAGNIQSITVSSRGAARYCKKCQTPKPDRAHHCSTCKRCVLKMDHHCPWLATCLGLHNYKAFVLFLIYTSLFCWVCLGSSAWWMYTQLFADDQYLEEFAPVNIIMLSVVSGIIGLVLSGFTGWHIYLCTRGQTTIECLEKTRYLSGVRSRVERNRQEQHLHNKQDGVAGTLQRAGEQILEFHANAVPGASRYEEGEDHASPAPGTHMANPFNTPTYDDPALHSQMKPSETESPALRSLRRTYSAVEQQRERERYDEYLDDKDSEKLPNAFDLGWKRNLNHLFGPNPFLWGLPVCNTTGDGWRWEVSQKWTLANEEVAHRKAERLRVAEAQARAQVQAQYGGGVGIRGGGSDYYQHHHQNDFDYYYDAQGNPRRDQNGQYDNQYSNSAMSMQTLSRPSQPPHPPLRQQGRVPKQRRDFDQAEEGGEIGVFQVSSDEADDNHNDYEDADSHGNDEEYVVGHGTARRGRRNWKDR